MKKFGKVYIVGAGPGDVGLITQLGAKLLKKADVVVMDALVNPALLHATKAKIIYAGKRGPGAPLGSSADYSQDGINKLLVRLGRRGLPVVMGGVIVIAAAFVVINMLVDIIYGWIDPRIRIG